MQPVEKSTSLIRPLLSTSALLATFTLIFFLLDRFDWDAAFARFVCLAALLAICLVTRRPVRGLVRGNERTDQIELILAISLVFLLAERTMYLAWSEFNQPPRIDIGVTTQDAARMLLLEGANPYQSKSIAVLGDDPQYWGYKYGPAMILGYALCAVSNIWGIKASNIIYLGASLAAVFLLARDREKSRRGQNATAWLCCALMLIPNRLWYELFYQGVIDIFPITLILFSLLFLGRNAWFIAGLLAGLSFSAKFSPGIFYLCLFLKRERIPRFFAGVLAGLVPLAVFLTWDAGALIRNFLVFHLIKGPDSTSLYSITPRELHPVFPLIQLATAACILLGNYKDKIEPRRLVWQLLLLILVVEATYKEVHENHLIWFIPLMALHLGTYRHEFLPGLLRAAVAFSKDPAGPPIERITAPGHHVPLEETAVSGPQYIQNHFH